MVTIFTTFRECTLAVENALSSWLNLADDIEIIVFTEQTVLPGISDARLVLCNLFKKDTHGLPYLNYIFEEASRIASHPLLCYCNSDIILLKPIVFCFKRLRGMDRFLAVSRRVDVQINYKVDFSNGSSNSNIANLAKVKGNIHPPLGSDLFVFPRYQYDQRTMPQLVVGRPGWDNWMIYDARKRFNALIDLRCPYEVIHQDHAGNYNSMNAEHQVNYHYLPNGYWYVFVLSYCNFYVSNGLIKRGLFFPWRSRGSFQDIVSRLKWEREFHRGLAGYFLYSALFLYYVKIKKFGSILISQARKQWS